MGDVCHRCQPNEDGIDDGSRCASCRDDLEREAALKENAELKVLLSKIRQELPHPAHCGWWNDQKCRCLFSVIDRVLAAKSGFKEE